MTQRDHRIQTQVDIYQGRGLPGYDARPNQPSIVERSKSGEVLRPGWAVKFNRTDREWYLVNDSEGTVHAVVTDVTAARGGTPADPALGDYITVNQPNGNPVDNVYYGTDGTAALNNVNSIPANTEFRYVQQAAGDANRRWVRTSAGSQVGAAGQYAVPHGSDRALAEGVLFFHPNVVPKTAYSIPSGSQSPDYVEYASGQTIHVMQFLGCIFGVAGAALRYKDEIEYDAANHRWILAPTTARAGRRARFVCEDREVSSGELVAVRIWGF